ncbi:metal ABC transporter solute-binding protein, Zn/Mn family [Arthrobacter sp. zg-Y1171]|uniref:metal ABC transporter solute-binding protein, Zn/Mn family n=1 Tax=Arthrobacter sp. zg-Y1171 TaxID=2964610 RepID=UPI002105E313|nr:zinc ABC transporter substrate-binding protein [Arthrobacter sp. zg-Y1171]MCQ1995004.1 zinc ABC transporter substrate-binding protein [Arthrobacter sp. zg-Y1171]UWX80943.1 zinc ABC transporter substrate-binding protein [Arthrobacter sp. zg-Y1171]
MRRFPVRLAGTVLAAAALALTGCSGGSGDDGGEAEGSDGVVRVVASTDVYGSILAGIGGDNVEVTSLIDRPSQDPHSYEASARDRLAVSKADLVVLNGGGYDTFLEKLAADEGIPAENILNAVEISGLEDSDSAEAEESHDAGEDHHGHNHGSFNEHVWYSPEAMGRLADAAAERLGELDADAAGTFRSNAADFTAGIADIDASLAALRETAGGRDVALTEPVPDYLVEAAGLHNATPSDFTEAVEEGSDVPPHVLKEMQDLVTGGSIAFLGYNEQTSTSQTEAVRKAALDAGVPVIDFSETLPEGQDYLQWMADNTANMESVLQ